MSENPCDWCQWPTKKRSSDPTPMVIIDFYKLDIAVTLCESHLREWAKEWANE